MKNIEQKIDETLASLKDIERAEPNPFFYTRLKARMENTQAQLPLQIRWILNPSVIFSTLTLVLALNIVSIINYSKQKDKQENIESFTSEYGLD
jgi:hypothetical protein